MGVVGELPYTRDIVGVKKCITEALIDILSGEVDISPERIRRLFEEQRIKITKTPDPKFGDIGIPLHPILYMGHIDRSRWVEIGSRIVEKITGREHIDKCYISRAEFVNGYLNIWIDYKRLLEKLVENILLGKLDEMLRSIGRGVKVIVEHTSANPVHPLHIGSGRNAVIGSIYANLLRRLGYDVSERFYVDDMGRQVAIMIYGYKILRENNVKPRRDVKIDHWFGAVYALTNILIEKRKLLRKLNLLEEEFTAKLNELKDRVRKIYGESGDPHTIQLLTILENLEAKKEFIHRYDEELARLRNIFEKLHDKKGLAEYVSEIIGYINKYNGLIKELSTYTSSENKLAIQFPEIYNVLSREIKDPDRAERGIDELIHGYEYGDRDISELFREATSMVLEGFKETLKNINIWFEGYDWESDRRILEYTRMVVEKASKLPYTIIDGRAVIVDLDKAAEEHEYIRLIFGGDKPGRVVLRRSDGTTLYVTRDIAYSIYKFLDLGADKVYNVIAHEQDREQKQVRAILYLLGYRDIAENLIHFQYEMVHLKGRSMSGRRGIYYTLDELFRDYVKTIILDYLDTQLRLGRRKFNYDELRDTASKLAVTNIRVLLSSIDPKKVLVFEPDKLREYLYGSWITYTFVRLQGILRRYLGIEPLDEIVELKTRILNVYHSIGDDVELSVEERNILEKLTDYGEVLITSADYMEPNKLVEYMNELGMMLNRFYEKHPVIGEKRESLRYLRIVIVTLSLLILHDLFNILKLPIIKKI